MDHRKLLCLLIGAYLIVGGAAAAQIAAGDTDPAPEDNACLPFTLAIGDMSGVYDDMNFPGKDFVITDKDAWAELWKFHTRFMDPAPALPEVDFRRDVVLACVQGWQKTGGMSAIYITKVVPASDISPVAPYALVVDDERPGPLDVLTNPFHFVRVSKECVPPIIANSYFKHVAATPDTGVVRGNVYAPAGPTYRPLPGAVVTLVRPDSITPRPPTAVTGLDGSYFFLNLRPGSATLIVTAPPYESQRAPIRIFANSRTYQNFYMGPW
jgi:hypothetical protein